MVVAGLWFPDLSVGLLVGGSVLDKILYRSQAVPKPVMACWILGLLDEESKPSRIWCQPADVLARTSQGRLWCCGGPGSSACPLVCKVTVQEIPRLVPSYQWVNPGPRASANPQAAEPAPGVSGCRD